MIRHLFAAIPADDTSALVERPAPGAAPTAFRIWAAGRNDSDDGPVYFTKESAARLMAEQAARGRQYSIDFDHLSLQSDRPATSGRAAGYHRIETRPDANGELELWAVGIEWCEDVRQGLELAVPHWKFFSPAFVTRVVGEGKTATDTGEIAGYLNFALCINPKTHDLPALAAATPCSQPATKGNAMVNESPKVTVDPDKAEPSKLQAQMQAMIDNEVDNDKRATLTQAMALAFPPEDAAKKDTGGSPDSPDGDTLKKQQDAVTEDNPRKDDDAQHKASKSIDATVKLAVTAAMNAREEEQRKRSAIDAEVDGREDLPPALKTWAKAQPVTIVRSFLDNAPKQMAQRNAKPAQPGADVANGFAPLLSGVDRDLMDSQMGIHANAARLPEKQSDGSLVVHITKPSAVRAAAQKGNDR